MTKQLTAIFIVILGFSQVARAQDPQFSQFYANPLYLNPAFAGSDRCPRANVNYRNQWPALNRAFVTYSASYDQHVDWLEGGVGLNLVYDVQDRGAVNTMYANFMYAYTFKINRKFFVRGGFQASYIHKQLGSDHIFPDQIHPLYGNIYPTNENLAATADSKGFFDFSMGALGYTGNHYFGIAVHHITQPSESYRENSDAVLPRKYTVHYGTKIPLRMAGFKKGELYISPNVIYQRQQDFEQFNYGLYFNRKSIVGGFWFRQNFKFQYDSFIMMLGFIQDQVRISYSYDLTVSRLRNATLGSHEIGLGYTFPCKSKRTKFRAISCPSF
jgi:type IX secretion system PorP/SprF family membrane protein